MAKSTSPAVTEVQYGYVRTGESPRLWLRCPYARREDAKRIPGYHWDADAKCWWWLLNGSNEIVLERMVRSLFPDASYASSSIEAEDGPAIPASLADILQPVDYEWRRQPYDHQRATVAASMVRDRFLVLDEMGLGKTQGAIDAACVAMSEGAVQRCVIICPTSLRKTWEDEITAVATVSPDDIAVVRKNPRAATGDRMRGYSDREYREYQLERRATWTIIHYPVVRLHVNQIAVLVKDQFLVADEAQKVKNPDSAVSKALLSFAPARAIMQTGTPVENYPADVWPIAYFCAPELIGSRWRFQKRYVVFTPIKIKLRGNGGRAFTKTIQKPTGVRNLGELRAMLRSIGLRRRKEDCLDLPPKLFSDRFCEMGPQQGRAYRSMQEQLEVWFRNKDDHLLRVESRSVASQIMRLCQISDGFVSPEAGIETWIEDAGKLEALDDIVDEVVSDGRKLIIWSRFVPVTRHVEERYSEHGSVRIAGEIEQEDRYENARRFLEDDDCQVFVGQYHTAGLGLNLQSASCAVLFDLWWNPAVNMQAIDRAHRIGQTRPLDVIRLITEGSIDEEVIAKLEQKQRWADAVTGDNGTPEGTDGQQLELQAADLTWTMEDIRRMLRKE